jgi:integrase
MRRGRGEGAIFKRADGLWCSSVSMGYDAGGKRLRPTVYGATKAEVQDKLRRMKSGDLSDTDRTTVGQWLARWLEIVKPTVEPNTYRPYQRHVEKHITPRIGGTRLAKLRPSDVERFYSALLTAGVSPAMTRKVGTTLTVALNAAVRLELLPGNPAARVRKPKAEKVEIEVLDAGQASLFLDAAEADRLYALFVLALDSGMRPGELFALAWDDIDFAGGFVSVTRSLEEIDGRHRLKDVKTKKARRRIDIDAGTALILHEHRKRMVAEGFAASPVFCDTQGGWLRISNVHRNNFKPALMRAGVPAVSLYALRHTCATLLLLAGKNPKVVSERLGHSSVTLTLDTYSHVLPTMQKDAAETMGRLLGRCRKDQAG